MTGTSPPRLTDRTALTRNRARAKDAALFLHDMAREDLQDRLTMVNRSFTAPAVVTGHPAKWADVLPDAKVISDTEVLDLDQGAHDLVIHAMALHWADDPLGQIIQCTRALKPDGLFLATFLGGQTLHQLRASLGQAEADITGGLSPRVAPMAEIRDMGGLLQRAGLALPVADGDPLTVSYATPLHLMRELRDMGEANALDQRLRQPTRKSVMMRAMQIYTESYSTGDRIPATFEMITLTGWAPDANQPQPLRPGSATTRLADALNARELPLKD